MLARERAAELDHQVADLDHRGAKLRDPFGGEEIEIDAAMDAALAEMAVVGRRRQVVAGRAAARNGAENRPGAPAAPRMSSAPGQVRGWPGTNAPAPSPDSRRLQTARCSTASNSSATPAHARIAPGLRASAPRPPPRASSAVSAPSSTIRNARPSGSSRTAVDAPWRARNRADDGRSPPAPADDAPISTAPDRPRGKRRRSPAPPARAGAGFGTSRTVAASVTRERPLRADQRARQVEAVLGQKLVEVVAGDAARNFRIAPSNLVAVALRERARRRHKSRRSRPPRAAAASASPSPPRRASAGCRRKAATSSASTLSTVLPWAAE